MCTHTNLCASVGSLGGGFHLRSLSCPVSASERPVRKQAGTGEHGADTGVSQIRGQALGLCLNRTLVALPGIPPRVWQAGGNLSPQVLVVGSSSAPACP